MTTIVLLIFCAVTLTLVRLSHEIPVPGQCKPDTCLNNGTCEIGYMGKGYKCKCLNSDLLFYGPNCEIASIGFHASDGAKWVRSAHSINMPYYNKLHLMFEFIGRCYKNEKSCVVLNLTQLPLSVWLQESDADKTKYTWNFGFKNRNYGPLGGKINTNKWMTTEIEVTDQSITASVTSQHLEDGDQEGRLNEPLIKTLDIQTDFRFSKLMLGGFYGCVRFVRINGKLVDLGSATLEDSTGPINKADYNKYASHFCYPTEKSCHSRTSQPGQRIFDSNSRTKCGANSKCDGVLDSAMGCSCRCDIGKRRQLETLTNNDKCWQNLTEQDECVEDTTTVSTGQFMDFQLTWKSSDSKCLGISTRAFSIEFMVLTRQVRGPSLLKLVLQGGDISFLAIDMQAGYLYFYIYGKKTSDYEFPRLSVSDDVWHEVSVVKQMNRVTLTIGENTTVENLPEDTVLSPICHIAMNLPKSCIRGFRISGVTMPVRETDHHISGKKIMVGKHPGVSVGDHCDFSKTGLTPPTCDPACKDNEECSGLISGPPKCFCKKPFVKQDETCVDPLATTSTIPTSTESNLNDTDCS